MTNLSKNKPFFYAVAIYVGTAVGAGIFGIPYAMAKFGFLPSLIYLLLLSGAIALSSLFYGEVVLRTQKKQQLVGYAGRYIGRWGRKIVLFCAVFGNYGALLAYTIGVGQFLFELLSPYFGGSPFVYSLIFFAVMAFILLKGLKIVAGAELGMSFSFIAIIFLLLALCWFYINWSNFLTFHPENFFLPYGVILFAVGALTSVPLIRETLASNNQERDLKKAVVIGASVTSVIYLIFAFLVIGVTGENTSQEGIIGLSNTLGTYVLIIGSFFGILTMSTSFLGLGLVLKEIYKIDYKMSNLTSWLSVCVIPLAIFLLGMNEFIKVVAIVGSIVGGLEGIMIILMWRRAKKTGDRQPEYALRLPGIIPVLLSVVFLAGLIYQIVYSFN